MIGEAGDGRVGRGRLAADANERSEDNFCSMKITQEVREFAQRQTAQDRPGDGSEARAREFAAKQNAGAETFVAAEEAEAGMAEMAERYRKGGDLYMLAED